MVSAAQNCGNTNTKITYLYRDASNYKQSGEVVVRGAITFADLEPYLVEGTDFVPEDVGLSHPGEQFSGSFPTEDDHPYCELNDSFEPTTEEGTVDAQVLIDQFRRADAAGWPGGDRDVTPRKGRVVPRQCKRCGATSTGGVYCPNGCGKI